MKIYVVRFCWRYDDTIDSIYIDHKIAFDKKERSQYQLVKSQKNIWLQHYYIQELEVPELKEYI